MRLFLWSFIELYAIRRWLRILHSSLNPMLRIGLGSSRDERLAFF